MVCINRDNKPATCCCGCSLVCGIVTLAILHSLGVISNIAAGSWGGACGQLTVLVPMYLTLFMEESKTLRLVNVFIQGGILALMIVGILVFIILIFAADLPHYFCNLAKPDLSDFDINLDHIHDEECEKHVGLYLWIAVLIVTFLTVPLQYLFYAIFQAHYDEIKGEPEYQQLNQQEV